MPTISAILIEFVTIFVNHHLQIVQETKGEEAIELYTINDKGYTCMFVFITLQVWNIKSKYITYVAHYNICGHKINLITFFVLG